MKQKLQTAWERFRSAPEEENFRPLFEGTRAVVYTICLRRCGDAAMDAFQGTWARLLAIAADPVQANAVADVDLLLKRLAVREADMWRKRSQREAHREAGGILAEDVAEGRSLMESLSTRELRGQLEGLVASLPESLRVALQLHYFDGLSHGEVAEILGVPKATISSRIARGVELLRPKARRAGLGDLVGAFAAIGSFAGLMSVPAGATTGAVFAAASAIATGQAALSVPAMMAGGSGSGAPLMVGGAVLGTAAVIGLILFWQTTPPAQQPIARAVATLAPTPAPTAVVISTPIREAIRPLLVVAVPAPIPSPAPSPMPDVPMVFRAEWVGSEDAAASTTLTLLTTPSQVLLTDAAGRATLMGEGTVTLLASHPEAEDFVTSVTLSRRGGEIAVALTRTTDLFGRVLRAGVSEPVAGATVTLGETNRTTRTDAGGNFLLRRVPKGAHAVNARIESLRQGGDPPIIIIESGQRNGPVDLRLSEAAVLTGRVVDAATGAPIANPTLRFFKDWNSQVWSANDSTRTFGTSGGEFRVSGLADGFTGVAVSAPGYAARHTLVRLSQDVGTRREFSLEKGVTAIVTVKDPKDAPIEGVGFELKSRNSLFFFSVDTVTDKDGRAVIDTLSPGNMPRIQLRSKEWFCEEQQIEHLAWQRETSVLIVAKPRSAKNGPNSSQVKGGELSGRVLNEAGEPVEGARVHSNAPNWFGRHVYEIVSTSADGRFRVGSVATQATVMLHVVAPGYAPTTVRDLNLALDREVKDIQLEIGQTISGIVVDEDGAAIPHAALEPQYLFPRKNNHPLPVDRPMGIGAPKTDGDGQFVFTHQPGEGINLNVQAPGFRPTTFKELRGRDRRLVLVRLGRILAQIRDAESGAPVPDVMVRRWYPDESTHDSRAVLGESFSHPEGLIDVGDLTSGLSAMTVEAPGYPLHHFANLALSKSSELPQILKLSRGRQVRGQIMDRITSKPVSDAEVRVIWQNPTQQYHAGSDEWEGLNEDVFGKYRVRVATIADDGTFSFREGSLQPWLLVRAPGFAQRVIAPTEREKLLDKDSGTITIPLQAETSIVGKLDYQGGPLAGARVTIMGPLSWGMGMIRGLEARTDPQGRFAFSGLARGEYRAGVEFGKTFVSEYITANQSKQTLWNPAERMGPHAVKGTIMLDGKPLPFSVAIFRIGGLSFTRPGEPSGQFEITGLPRGTAKVELRRWNHDNHPVANHEILYERKFEYEIRGDTTVEFEISKRGVVRLTLAEPEGAVGLQLSLYQQSAKPGDEPDATLTKVGDRWEVRGGLQGRYRLVANWPLWDTVVKTGIRIDSTNSDVDLGTISYPPMGAVTLRSAEQMKGQAFVTLALKSKDVATPSYLITALQDGVVTARNIPEGRYEVSSSGIGFRAAGKEQFLTVRRGKTSEFVLELEPIGMLRGQILTPVAEGQSWKQGMNGKYYDYPKVTSVRLVGLGVDKTLGQSGRARTMQELSDSTGKDVLTSQYFSFSNLGAGTYTLTIEAENMTPLVREVTVKLGESGDYMPPIYEMAE